MDKTWLGVQGKSEGRAIANSDRRNYRAAQAAWQLSRMARFKGRHSGGLLLKSLAQLGHDNHQSQLRINQTVGQILAVHDQAACLPETLK